MVGIPPPSSLLPLPSPSLFPPPSSLLSPLSSFPYPALLAPIRRHLGVPTYGSGPLCAEGCTNHGRRAHTLRRRAHPIGEWHTLCAEGCTNHGKMGKLCAEGCTNHGRRGGSLRRGFSLFPGRRYTHRCTPLSPPREEAYPPLYTLLHTKEGGIPTVVHTVIHPGKEAYTPLYTQRYTQGVYSWVCTPLLASLGVYIRVCTPLLALLGGYVRYVHPS